MKTFLKILLGTFLLASTAMAQIPRNFGNHSISTDSMIVNQYFKFSAGGVNGYILKYGSNGFASWAAPSSFVFGISQITGLQDTLNTKEKNLTFQQSLSRSGNTINLVNDLTSPGLDKSYGTDASGTRGWFDKTASGVNAVLGTLPITSSGGTNPVISSHKASASDSGYVTSTDWSTFNAKESALTFNAPLTRSVNAISADTGASKIATKTDLLSLSASNLTSGTLPDARLSGTYSSQLRLSNTANDAFGDTAKFSYFIPAGTSGQAGWWIRTGGQLTAATTTDTSISPQFKVGTIILRRSGGLEIEQSTIAAALSTATSGDEIVLNGGRYIITSSLTGKTGVNIRGLGGATIQANDTLINILNLPSVTDVQITGIRFVGKVNYLQTATDYTIVYTRKLGIYADTTSSDITIENCKFDSLQVSILLQGQRYAVIKNTGNKFTNAFVLTQGAKDVLVSENHIIGNHTALLAAASWSHQTSIWFTGNTGERCVASNNTFTDVGNAINISTPYSSASGNVVDLGFLGIISETAATPNQLEGRYVSITNNILTNILSVAGGPAGIAIHVGENIGNYTTTSHRVVVDGNIIRNATTGIIVSGRANVSGDERPTFVTVNGNVIDSTAAAGISLSMDDGIVSNNVIRKAGTNGISVGYANRVMFLNNRIEQSGSAGIQVVKQSSDLLIANNMLLSNGLPTGSGISVDSLTNGKIIGNIAKDLAVSGFAQQYGLVVGAASTGTTYRGNFFKGNTLYDWSISGSATNTNIDTVSFGHGTQLRFFNVFGTSRFSGAMSINAAVDATVFQDINDQSFYLDPSSASASANLNGPVVAKGTSTFRILNIGQSQNTTLTPFTVKNFAGTNKITGDTTGLGTFVGLTSTGAITATGQTISSGAITSTGTSAFQILNVGQGQNTVLAPFTVKNFAGTTKIAGDTTGNITLTASNADIISSGNLFLDAASGSAVNLRVGGSATALTVQTTLVGVGATATPKHALSQYNTTPNLAFTSTTKNLNISTAAQVIDTSAIELNYTSNTKKPYMNFIGPDGVKTFGVDSSGATTIGGGTAIAKVVNATRTYDCGEIAAGVDSTFSVTSTGAIAGNSVFVGVSVAAEAGLIITGECTSNDVVTVRISNHFLVAAVDPATRIYKVTVVNF